MTAVLVVESEHAMFRALCINLRARRYEARGVTSGRDGLVVAGRFHFDAVLLDCDLSDMEGIDVISGLRGWSSVPIVAIAHSDADADVICALDAGADDYLTKPIGMGELLARMRAVLRRSRPRGDVASVTTPDFTIDLAGKRAATALGDVPLTATEWRLVEILIRHAGKVVTRDALLREVWGPGFEKETQYLRVYIAQIRRKLEPVPSRPQYFVTHPGLGLRFESRVLGNDQSSAQTSAWPGTSPGATASAPCDGDLDPTLTTKELS